MIELLPTDEELSSMPATWGESRRPAVVAAFQEVAGVKE
jgi:hypothetical protein